MTSPLTAAASLVSMDAAKTYIDKLFQHVDLKEFGVISLLGVGEKGTDREGVFRERKFVDLSSPFGMSTVQSHIERWATHGIAAFIVPAALHRAAERDGDVKLDKVAALTSICVDIDSGDTEAKLEHLTKVMGPPSMVVYSGGHTETGQAKIHAYWMLTEPSEEVGRIGELRKSLAAKVGGDQSFGRPTQVIRIPGSVYAKAGAAKPVELVSVNALEYELEELAEAIDGMETMPGVELVIAAPAHVVGGMFDFSAGAGLGGSHAIEAMQRDVHEGGDTDRNRWGEFSAVAGFNIRQVRMGLMSLHDAAEATWGWCLAHMVPCWPRERFQQEFVGVVNTDMKTNGPFADTPLPGVNPIAAMAMETITSTDDLLSWAVNKRSSPAPKARRLLVDGLVFAGKRHMLVAEGGAGKTFLCMDLALKLASCGPDAPRTWLGQEIREDAHGGTVIIMTGEDDLEELDIRWNELDPGGELRASAGDRLIALPLDNLGGAFPLVTQHPTTREAIASPRWVQLYQAMRGIHERGGHVSALIIDTLNSTLHGEENSAMIISEYVRAVAPICGELKAALIVTHHVRKAGAEPIRTLEDMRDAIRGSSALPNAMRLVIGVWAAHDYERRMKAMGMKAERATLFMGGVVKANMPEALRYPKTLMRDKSGLLTDVTAMDRSARGATAEHEAWIVWAVQRAADERSPFARTGANGLHARRHQLPSIFHNLTRDGDITPLIDKLLSAGRIISMVPANAGKAHSYLDVPLSPQVPRYLNVGAVLDLKCSEFYYDHGYDEIRNASGEDDY